MLVKAVLLKSDINPVQNGLSKTGDQLIHGWVWVLKHCHQEFVSFFLDLFTWLCTSLVSL